MPLFPLFANLSGREVLVIGGGEVAARKVEALLHAGAQVQVYAKALNETLSRWLQEGRLQRREGEFDAGWLDQAWLLVAATDDHDFNHLLADEAARRRKLVNVVDDAELSTFQIPSVVDRAPLQVAISSGGAAPMLARQLREQLEAQLDHSLGDFAELFARHRAQIRQRLPDLAQRRRWFEQVLDGPVALLLRNGQASAAEQAFQSALQGSAGVSATGSVMLVGAGSGDPGLLTLKALRALNQADLLVVDAAVGHDILALARRDAARQPMPADHDAQLELLVRQVDAGQRVVMLKPGDPYRTAPDDALAQALAERGIACEVIAGIDFPD